MQDESLGEEGEDALMEAAEEGVEQRSGRSDFMFQRVVEEAQEEEEKTGRRRLTGWWRGGESGCTGHRELSDWWRAAEIRMFRRFPRRCI